MSEQIEKLVRVAVEACALVDVAYEAGGDVRVNIYPREPVQHVTMTASIDTTEMRQEIEKLGSWLKGEGEQGQATAAQIASLSVRITMLEGSLHRRDPARWAEERAAAER